MFFLNWTCLVEIGFAIKLNLTPALFVFPWSTYECGYAADEQLLNVKLLKNNKKLLIKEHKTVSKDKIAQSGVEVKELIGGFLYCTLIKYSELGSQGSIRR